MKKANIFLKVNFIIIYKKVNRLVYVFIDWPWNASILEINNEELINLAIKLNFMKSIKAF